MNAALFLSGLCIGALLVTVAGFFLYMGLDKLSERRAKESV
jgi:hypothetical protein